MSSVHDKPLWKGNSAVLYERGDLQLFSELIEILHERGWERNAARASLLPLGVTLLSRQPDSIDAGQAFRPADVPHQFVDAALELVERLEHADVDGYDRVPGISGRDVVVIEIDHRPAHRGPVERARKQPDDEREA